MHRPPIQDQDFHFIPSGPPLLNLSESVVERNRIFVCVRNSGRWIMLKEGIQREKNGKRLGLGTVLLGASQPAEHYLYVEDREGRKLNLQRVARRKT
jgi:hypothetical protein